MKTTNLLSLISTAVIALSQPAWAGGGGGGGFHGGGFGGGFRGGGFGGGGGFRGGGLAAQPIAGGAVSRGGGVGFGSPRFAAADFAQPRIRMAALILPLEVSAAQPVHSDITTEAAAALLLRHTNSEERETNRRDRMPGGTQPLLASRIARHHQQRKT